MCSEERDLSGEGQVIDGTKHVETTEYFQTTDTYEEN